MEPRLKILYDDDDDDDDDYKLYFGNWNNLNQWPTVKIGVDLGVKSQILN